MQALALAFPAFPSTLSNDVRVAVNVCLFTLGFDAKYFGGGLPTQADVLARIAGWPAAEAVRDFVVQAGSSRESVDESDFQALCESLQDLQGTEAQDALAKLKAAHGAAFDPCRWVEVVVNRKRTPEQVDKINGARNNAHVRWYREDDEKVQTQVVLPLTFWDTGSTGTDPVSNLGRVAEVDEAAMAERLQVLLDLRRRGGLVSSTSPVTLRPDGRHAFFAQLIPADLT